MRSRPLLAVLPDLAAAQHDAKLRDKAAAAAAALVVTARERVDQARAAQRRIADLAARAVTLSANKLRCNDLSPLPADLTAARRSLFEVDQDHADAAAVLVLLEAEAVEAEGEAAAVRKALALTADVAMQRKALELVGELRELEIEAGRLRGLIGGLAASRGFSEPPLAWSIQAIGHDGQHPFLVDGAGPNWASAART